MTMKKTLWVVYEIGAAERNQGMNVVCEQGEWDALELAQPSAKTSSRLMCISRHTS